MEQGEINKNVELDPERQKKAKEYARINHRLMLVDLLFTAVYLVAWLVFGWSKSLTDWLMGFTTNEWMLVFLYVIIFGGILFLINLPLSYYQSYVLPLRYELSTETQAGWISDQLKMITVGGVIGLIILEIIYAVLRGYPTTWWLWAAGILLAFNVILEKIAPTILMPMFNKFVPLGDEHADLTQRIMQLTQRSGTIVIGVFKFDMSRRTKQANAGLAGSGKTRRIILGDTLLDEFPAEEIETIVAHELGHQVNRDIPLGIIFGSVITLVGLYLAALGLNWGVKVFGFENPADIAAFPLFVIVLGLYGLVSMPLENGFSRWRERRADEFALKITRNGDAYASALKRLANQNLADAEPERWVEWFLYSHPALGRRIAMAEQAGSTMH